MALGTTSTSAMARIKATALGTTVEDTTSGTTEALGTTALGTTATAPPAGEGAHAGLREGEHEARPYRSLGDWLEGLEEEERGEVSRLFEAETQGLKSALKAEREARGGLEKRLRELSKEIEAAAPATAAQLEALGADLAAMRRRVAFYEGAPADLWNARLGWLAAQEIGAFDQEGNVEWAALRSTFPELFGAVGYTAPLGGIPAGVGAGAGGFRNPVVSGDMNAAIRRAAGRRRGG